MSKVLQNAPLRAFCTTFDMHLAITGLEIQFSVFLRVAVLHRFYCTLKPTCTYNAEDEINSMSGDFQTITNRRKSICSAYTPRNAYTLVFLHARIQRGRGPNPPGKSQIYRVPSECWSGPSVPSQHAMLVHRRFAGGPMMARFQLYTGFS